MTTRREPPGAGREEFGWRADRKRKGRNERKPTTLLLNRQFLLFVLQAAFAFVKLARAVWSLIHSS